MALDSILVFEMLLDFVYELLHFVLLQADAFLAESRGDFVTSVRPFLGGEEETYCGACDGAADYSAYNMNGFHNYNGF